MEPTNPEGSDSRNSSSNNTQENLEEPKKATLGEIYEYITGPYYMLFIIGSIAAFTGGADYPFIIFFLARVFNDFGEESASTMHDKIMDNAWFIMGVAGIAFITNLVYYCCFTLIGKKINYELRWRYIQAVLRQDNSWFDKQIVEGIPTTIHKNLRDIEVASGRTVAFLIYSVGTVISGAGITFGAGWIFCFTLFGVLVYCVVLGGFVEYSFGRVAKVSEDAFQKGGIQAEESISAIKVVKAFGQEEKCTKDFNFHLENKHDEIMSMAWLYGIAFGCLETMCYVAVAYRGSFILKLI